MTFTNLIIGLPIMLLCLMVQSVIAFWCVRYYVRQSSHAAEHHCQSGAWTLSVADTRG